MLGVTIVILLSLGAIGGGALIWTRTRHLPALARVLLALVPVSAAAVAYLIAWTCFNAPNLDWNGGKLAPILAMVKAEQADESRLYQEPYTGVMTAWIYGPMPALLFLPAAVASRPTNAILIALFINACLYFGPPLWAHLRLTRMAVKQLDPDGPPSHYASLRWFAFLTFLIFIWITMFNESLCRAALMVAPDAPTLAFAVTSIVLLFYRRTPLVLVASALCAVLTCWCKQSAVPFLFVAPVYILIADGLVAAVSYVLILVIVGAVSSTTLLLSFGPYNMWFHMVKLSKSHGWENEAELGRLHLFFRALLMLISEMIPTLALIGLAALVKHFFLPARAVIGTRLQRFLAWAHDNPWLMFIIAAIFFVPSSLLGFLKVGGYVNNFSLTHLFVALTACTVLIRLYAMILALMRDPSSTALPISPAHLRTAVLCSLALLAMWYWPDVLLRPKRAAAMYRVLKNPWDNQQETIYEFAKAHPGIVYFPWNNLSMLLAEKRQYHFEWGLHDRYEAGIDPSEEQIRAHIPPRVRYVAFGPFHQGQETHQRWFSHATAQVNDERLKGFTIYTFPTPEQLQQQPQPPTGATRDFDLTPR